MSDIVDLYQEIILDHSKYPKNFGQLAKKTHQALGKNPLCGDMLSLELKIANGKIDDIAFVGDGCAISKASASLMTEFVKNKTIEEAKNILEDFVKMLTTDDQVMDLGKLQILSGVKDFPLRVKCATLAWQALKAALLNEIKE